MTIDYAQLITAEAKAAQAADALLAAKEQARLSVQRWIDGFLANISGPIPNDEKLAWTAKAEAARAVLTGEATPLQLAILGPEAEVRGISLSDLARRVVAKADLYTRVVAVTAGLRDNTWEAIKLAGSEAEIAAALAGAEASARGFASQLGLQV